MNNKLDSSSVAHGYYIGQQSTYSFLSVKSHGSPKGHLKDTEKVTCFLVCTSQLQTSSCHRHHREEIQRPQGLKSEPHHTEIQEIPNFFRDVFGKSALCVSPLYFQLTRFQEVFSFLLQEQYIFSIEKHEKKTKTTTGSYC